MKHRIVRAGSRVAYAWKSVLREYRHLSRTEKIMRGTFIAASFIGIWHALPLVNLVGDEQYYVGSVFRALAAHSIFPLPGDVPYGTLTFYVNYLFALPVIGTLFVLNGFSVSALQSFLVLHASAWYIMPRIVSALLASVAVYVYDWFLKREGLPVVHRFAVLLIAFGSLVSGVMLHTGKMWTLSTLLVFLSLILLYKALNEPQWKRARTAAFLSVLIAFASFANFPLSALSLVVVPILLFTHRKNRSAVVDIIRVAFCGGLLALGVFAINSANIIGQVLEIFTRYHPVVGPHVNDNATSSLPVSFILHSEQILYAFPLVLMLIVSMIFRNAIRNRLLAALALFYAFLYFVTLVFLVTWFSAPGEFLRHMLPFAFFFSALVAALDFKKTRWTLPLFIVPQALLYIFLLFLLVMPTTFNQTRSFVIDHFSTEHVLILHSVSQVDLPLNAESAGHMQERFCASRCVYTRTHPEVEPFKPVVFDLKSVLTDIQPAAFSRIMWIGDHPLTAPCAATSTASFSTGAPGTYFEIEKNLGSYVAPGFLHLTRLGTDMYIYEVSPTCVPDLLTEMGAKQPLPFETL